MTTKTETHNCPGCAAEIPTYCVLCHTCARIAKAEKLDSWDGPVELDGDYWGSIEAFLEAWPENHEDGDKRPDYLWACKTHPFSTRDGAQKLIERASEEFPEEMDCRITGIEALEAAVAAFEEANKGLVTWSPLNKVVRIPWEVLEGKD